MILFAITQEICYIPKTFKYYICLALQELFASSSQDQCEQLDTKICFVKFGDASAVAASIISQMNRPSLHSSSLEIIQCPDTLKCQS